MVNSTWLVELDDAGLVAESIAGNRNAFAQIVARYQSLICSLAYSATGDLSQSEDLAQDTFIAAWKALASLREPPRLRSWLCGIARNLSHNCLRRQKHEPVHAAQPIEEVSEPPALDPQPVEQAISKEEEAIMWRSLERLPEIYREVLVLFYREHKSVPRVAQALELSEDAVHQRLTRGRKMLQEQVLAVVEGTLERSAPGMNFTLEVVAALPLLAGASNGVTASGLAAGFRSLLKLFPLCFFVSLGSWLGYVMGGDAAAPSTQRRTSVAQFWGILVGCLVIFAFLPVLLFGPLSRTWGRENVLAGMRFWLDVMFGVMTVATLLWVWQRRRQPAPHAAGAARSKPAALLVWLVVLGWTGAAGLFALGISDSNFSINYISAGQARRVIVDNYKNAEIFVCRYQSGADELWIKYLKNGKVVKSIAPADRPTLSLLKEKGIHFPLYVQGRNFEVFGWQGKALLNVCLLILIVGTVALLTLAIKNRSKGPLMTKQSKIALASVVILIALIVTPLVWLNHQKVNTVHPNQIGALTLDATQSALAQQRARDFFEALGNGDWKKVAGLCPSGFSLADRLDARAKSELAGLQVVSLGQPFTQAWYPGVYVPYEIRFKNGETKKFNLAVRQDNPERKWHFDGGL